MATTPTKGPHAITREWFEQALNLPCTCYLASRGRNCGAKPTRQYAQGRRCPRHIPKPRKNN